MHFAIVVCRMYVLCTFARMHQIQLICKSYELLSHVSHICDPVSILSLLHAYAIVPYSQLIMYWRIHCVLPSKILNAALASINTYWIPIIRCILTAVSLSSLAINDSLTQYTSVTHPLHIIHTRIGQDSRKWVVRPRKGKANHQKQNAWQTTVFFTRVNVFVI